MKSFFVYMLIFILLLLCACEKKTEQPLELKKVRIGLQNNTASSIILIANEMGYFKQNGLEVELTDYPSGKLAFKAMLAGETDLSTVADIPLTIGAINNEPFKIIATISETDKGAWIVANRAKGINSVEDLRGKRIGTQENSAVHFFLHLFLLKHNLHEDFIPVLMPANQLVDALVNDKIDAFSMRNPYIQQAKDNLGNNAIEFIESGLYVQSFNLVANDKFISEQTETVNNVVKSLLEAEEYLLQDPEKAIQAVIKQFGHDRETEVRNDWVKYDFQVSLKQYLVILLEDETIFAGHRGLVEEGKIPNFLNFIYQDALLKCAPQNVSIIK